MAGLPYLVQPADADSVADVFDIRLCSDCYVDVAGSNGPPVFDEPGGPLDDPGDENGE